MDFASSVLQDKGVVDLKTAEESNIAKRTTTGPRYLDAFGQEIWVGDLVEVIAPSDIVATLDGNGALDGMPFMPEMVEFCGRRFRVSCRVEKTCVVSAESGTKIRTSTKDFLNGGIVFLQDVRCSGAGHANCGRGCMIFWKTRWLRKATDRPSALRSDNLAETQLRSSLKSKKSKHRFYCQSTELHRATVYLSILRRILKIPREIRDNGVSLSLALESIYFPVWKHIFPATRPRGRLKATPELTLNLRAGEIVEVRPYEEILRTLDRRGANRGLSFTAAMKRFCGAKLTVRSRLQQMILEHSGTMVQTRNTVILDTATCSFSGRFGGCPRLELLFWREIWLKRVDSNDP